MKERDLKRKLFALEYYKNGCNATKAAEAVGYSKKTAAQHGYTLLKDKYVKQELKALDKLLSLDKMTAPDKDKITSDIADITEVLTTLSRILRREMTEDSVVVLKSDKTDIIDGKKVTDHEEVPQIVEVRPKLSDVNKAADLLMRYFQSAKDNSESDGGGVVILAEVRKEE